MKNIWGYLKGFILKHSSAITGIIAVILLQQIISFGGKEFMLTQLTMSAYYSLVVVGLCMLMGYAGQISMGQAGFFAIGGYVSAVLTTQNLAVYKDTAVLKVLGTIGIIVKSNDIYGSTLYYLSPMLALILAVVITLGIAYIIGVPVLKLKGHYLAMATLGFGTIIYRIALGTKIFGEADGISSVPGFTLIPGLLQVTGQTGFKVQNYYIAWILVITGIIIAQNIINSRVGRALRSLHSGEDAAESVGINVSKYKLYIFIISAAFAAVAGVFLTHYNGGIGPSEAGVMKSVRYVSIVAVGGMANIWGTVIIGTLLNFLSLRGYFGSYDDIVFGAILIAIMLFTPDGILRKFSFRKKA
ncbi:MAG: branched-chain amino acid ABC transporter permease [Elusimicrobiota bacterium]